MSFVCNDSMCDPRALVERDSPCSLTSRQASIGTDRRTTSTSYREIVSNYFLSKLPRGVLHELQGICLSHFNFSLIDASVVNSHVAITERSWNHLRHSAHEIYRNTMSILMTRRAPSPQTHLAPCAPQFQIIVADGRPRDLATLAMCAGRIHGHLGSTRRRAGWKSQ